MDHLGGGENHEKLKAFQKLTNSHRIILQAYRLTLLSVISLYSYLSGLLARKAGVKKLNLVHHSRRGGSLKLEILSKKVELPMRIASQNLTANLILDLNLNQVVSQKSRHNISISLCLCFNLKFANKTD